MSDKHSILEDDQLFNALCRLKELAPDDALAVAGHISARSIQRNALRAELENAATTLECAATSKCDCLAATAKRIRAVLIEREGRHE